MGGFSIWHWLVVGVIVLLLFGKGRFSDMMGDVAKGLKSFKKGMSDDDEPAPRRLSDERAIDQRPVAPPETPVAAVPPAAAVPPTATVPPAAPAEHGSASEADRH